MRARPAAGTRGGRPFGSSSDPPPRPARDPAPARARPGDGAAGRGGGGLGSPARDGRLRTGWTRQPSSDGKAPPRPRVAVDAMGGDHGPRGGRPGAVERATGDPDMEVILVGDTARIEEHLDGPLPTNVTIVHASQVVDMHEDAALAVRRKRDATINVHAAHPRGPGGRRGECRALGAWGGVGGAPPSGCRGWTGPRSPSRW
ncbi:MAG: hypothetical protein R3C32_11830 [Chloroflexota bacterium]